VDGKTTKLMLTGIDMFAGETSVGVFFDKYKNTDFLIPL
jgi:hypothetical protein